MNQSKRNKSKKSYQSVSKNFALESRGEKIHNRIPYSIIAILEASRYQNIKSKNENSLKKKTILNVGKKHLHLPYETNIDMELITSSPVHMTSSSLRVNSDTTVSNNSIIPELEEFSQNSCTSAVSFSSLQAPSHEIGQRKPINRLEYIENVCYDRKSEKKTHDFKHYFDKDRKLFQLEFVNKKDTLEEENVIQNGISPLNQDKRKRKQAYIEKREKKLSNSINEDSKDLISKEFAPSSSHLLLKKRKRRTDNKSKISSFSENVKKNSNQKQRNKKFKDAIKYSNTIEGKSRGVELDIVSRTSAKGTRTNDQLLERAYGSNGSTSKDVKIQNNLRKTLHKSNQNQCINQSNIMAPTLSMLSKKKCVYGIEQQEQSSEFRVINKMSTNHDLRKGKNLIQSESNVLKKCNTNSIKTSLSLLKKKNQEDKHKYSVKTSCPIVVSDSSNINKIVSNDSGISPSNSSMKNISEVLSLSSCTTSNIQQQKINLETSAPKTVSCKIIEHFPNIDIIYAKNVCKAFFLNWMDDLSKDDLNIQRKCEKVIGHIHEYYSSMNYGNKTNLVPCNKKETSKESNCIPNNGANIHGQYDDRDGDCMKENAKAIKKMKPMESNKDSSTNKSSLTNAGLINRGFAHYDTTKYYFDYDSTSWVTSKQYRENALKLLAQDFSFLTKKAIEILFTSQNFHYAPSFRQIIEALGVPQKQSNSKQQSLEQNEDSINYMNVIGYQNEPTMIQKESLRVLLNRLSSTTSSTFYPTSEDRVLPTNIQVGDKIPSSFYIQPTNNKASISGSSSRVYIKDKILKNERLFLKERFSDLFLLLDEQNKVMCQCCFSDFDAEKVCQCEDGHIFCTKCLRKYVEEEFFGKGNVNLKCMCTEEIIVKGEGSEGEKVSVKCTRTFPRSQLAKAIPFDVMVKYDEALMLEDLEKANITDLCKCSRCGFQAILPPPEINFRCPQCEFVSCRHCGEESHFPRPCGQKESNNSTAGRKQIEEAMTEARLRMCPKCKKKFYKVDGCNKMKCTCGTLICYVCRKEVTNYTHFCSIPHCNHESCGKCVLFTDSVKDDARAVNEAAMYELDKLVASDPSFAVNAEIQSLVPIKQSQRYNMEKSPLKKEQMFSATQNRWARHEWNIRGRRRNDLRSHDVPPFQPWRENSWASRQIQHAFDVNENNSKKHNKWTSNYWLGDRECFQPTRFRNRFDNAPVERYETHNINSAILKLNEENGQEWGSKEHNSSLKWIRNGSSTCDGVARGWSMRQHINDKWRINGGTTVKSREKGMSLGWS